MSLNDLLNLIVAKIDLAKCVQALGHCGGVHQVPGTDLERMAMFQKIALNNYF